MSLECYDNLEKILRLWRIQISPQNVLRLVTVVNLQKFNTILIDYVKLPVFYNY